MGDESSSSNHRINNAPRLLLILVGIIAFLNVTILLNTSFLVRNENNTAQQREEIAMVLPQKIIIASVDTAITTNNALSGSSTNTTTALSKEQQREEQPSKKNNSNENHNINRTNTTLNTDTNEKENKKKNDSGVVDTAGVIETKMKELGLLHSSRHQSKFLSKRDFVSEAFPDHYQWRYQAKTGKDQVYNLGGNASYLHVWKSGGSTIKKQINMMKKKKQEQEQKAKNNAAKNKNKKVFFLPTHPEATERTWMTFVRDPIEHFLSGWAECGERRYRWSRSKNADKWSTAEKPIELVWNETEYDERVRDWLSVIQTTAQNKTSEEMTMSCETHSFPQANFVLNTSGRVYPNLRIVGDLREMKQLFLLPQPNPFFMGGGDFVYDTTIKPQKESSTNKVKQQFFPYRIDLLSNSTLLDLCGFLSLDYFLFDFRPPEICDGVS